MAQNILDIEPWELEKLVAAWGTGAYRAGQIIEWIYRKRVAAFSSFSNLPADIRERLELQFVLRSFSLEKKEVSKLDRTVRYTFLTPDKNRIYTVFLPGRDHNTVCVSTQIGCAVGCAFCTSGQTRFVRNLSRGEILEQVLQAENDTGEKIGSVLLMGMGEPLLNFDNVEEALRALTDKKQFFLSRRHVTVSTVGIVPQIKALSKAKAGVRLALSLHAPDDETRAKIIPPRRVPYTIEEILNAGLEYSRQNNARLTIEYILISGTNDTLLSAQKLVKLIKSTWYPDDDIRVNLIPCNVTPKKNWTPPDTETIQSFKEYIVRHRITATIRQPRGADIDAACGQLGF